MDWHEGFQVYGEYGSVVGKTYNPWLLKSSDVEIHSVRDEQFRRPLAIDGHSYRRQVEGFADAILRTSPCTGPRWRMAAAVRALIAISQSVKTGEPVRLKDVQGEV